MLFLSRQYLPRLAAVFIAAGAVIVSGCEGAGEGAVKGAGAGAVAGAASGLVSALIWGGDPGEHMVRGAATGATIGAVGGAVQGSQQAKATKDRETAQQQRELELYRRDIGDDAFNGVVALAECKHDVAIANGNTAARSRNSNHALSGLWVTTLAYADRGDEEAARGMYPELIRWDRDIDSESRASEVVESTLLELQDVRSEYHLPRTCN